MLTKSRGVLRWTVGSVALASVLCAADQRPRETGPTIAAQGAFLALVVTDLNASLDWYRSNLGLRVVKRGVSPRVAAETVVLGGEGIFVELIHFTDRQLSRRVVSDDAPVAGPVKTGAILGAADFDRLASSLKTEIFQDEEMGYRMFIVRDNDGNLLQFLARRS